MSKPVLAVFDLDHTLTSGRSLESAFLLFLCRRRVVSLRALLLSALFYLKKVWRDPVTASKRNKLYLKGTARRDAEQWVRDFLVEEGDGFLAREGERLVRQHKGLGHSTILVTGSPELLVGPLLHRRELPFDRVYSTSLEIIDGFFTGGILGTHYYGNEKAALVSRLAAELGADLGQSYCYADSKSDLAMMSQFGHPVAVNSDKALRRTAVERQWEILDLA